MAEQNFSCAEISDTERGSASLQAAALLHGRTQGVRGTSAALKADNVFCILLLLQPSSHKGIVTFYSAFAQSHHGQREPKSVCERSCLKHFLPRSSVEHFVVFLFPS